VGHGHSARLLCRVTGRLERYSVGFKRIQNNPNCIQTRPKLDSIQIGSSLALKISNKIWMENT
jgi:hypothetical protein